MFSDFTVYKLLYLSFSVGSAQALKVETASHPWTREQLIAYATAGFRTNSELLDHVKYRMGLLAVLS